LVLCLVLALGLLAPSSAGAFTSFGAPFTGAQDLVTGFPSCINPGGGSLTVGPYGGTSDATSLFISDICNGTTYKLPLSGGPVSSATSGATGFDVGVLFDMGSYFGTCSTRVTGCGPGNDGLYSFNGTTLARGSGIGGAIQPRQVTGDPLSTDLYLEVVDGGIDRVQNPGGSPTISSFAGGSDNFDGLGWAPGGSVLYAVDTTTSQVVGFNRSGTEVFDVDLSAYQPTGLAVAPAGDSVNGVNISGNVFTDNLDGTVTRINTTDGNAVSVVASGGGPGIAAFFDSQGHLDVAQPDSYVRLFGTQYTLTVTRSGSGTGTVTSAPAGIDCGGSCATLFDAGSSVTLSAAAAAGSKFTGWTGCDTTSGTRCTVTISADRDVAASFKLLPPGTKITKAKISSKHHQAKLSFKAIGTATGFQCALVEKPKKHHTKPKPHFKSCRSPKTYKHLKPGKYTFEVKALSRAGTGKVASKSFKIS
jgi:hypothetical protein